MIRMNKKASFEVRMIMILFLLFLLALARASIIEPSRNKLCEYSYGENYIHNYGSEFGHYCIRLNYETLTKEYSKPYNWTESERREICQTPGFFELNKWKGENC